MIAENALALSYILPADVYLLAKERSDITETVALQEDAIPPIAQVSEPAATYTETETAPAKQETPVSPAIATPAVSIPSIPSSVTIPVVNTPVSTPARPYNYIGNYQNNFLILVSYPDHEVIGPAHLAALKSTIERKGMSLDDAAIVNVSKYPGHDIRAIGGHFKPQKLLFLGKAAIPGGFTPPPFNQLAKVGKSDALYTYSFDEMMGNKEITKAFWEQMKML